MFKKLTRITCQQAHVLLSQRMDGPLPVAGRYKLYFHLAACTACSRVDKQFDVMRQAMKRLGS